MPLPSKASRFLVAFAACSAVVAGCAAPSDGPSPTDTGSTGQVQVFVKDAPNDNLTSVFVTISKVEVHRSARDLSATPTTTNATGDANATDDAEETSPSSDASEASWITVVSDEFTVDLKQYQGDARAFMGSAELEAGTYTQIRLTVDEMYGIESDDGDRVEIEVPSKTLKIVRPWQVPAGGAVCLVIDFDLDASLQARGRGGYLFKPTLKLSSDECPTTDGTQGTTATTATSPTATNATVP